MRYCFWLHMLITRHGILSLLFFLCPVTDISATATPIGVKFCTLVHIGTGQAFSPFRGGARRRSPKSVILGLNFGHLNATNISKTVSRSVTCRSELSSTRAFKKCISYGGSTGDFPNPKFSPFRMVGILFC